MKENVESVYEETPGHTCDECGKEVSKQDLIKIYENRVCSECKRYVVQQVKEGTYGRLSENYGGFWIRFLAKTLDGVLLMILFLPIYIFLMYYFGISFFEAGTNPGPESTMKMQIVIMLGQVVQTVLGLVYNVFFLGKYSATPGKMVCNLKAVTTDLEEFGYLRALGRTLAEWVSGMICWLGYVMAAFDDQKRTLHDRIASTRVIYD